MKKSCVFCQLWEIKSVSESFKKTQLAVNNLIKRNITRMIFKETKLQDFDISEITKKAIDKNGVNEPLLISAKLDKDDLELLFEVESTADEHHKVDLKGNNRDSVRGYAVVLRFSKARGLLYDEGNTKGPEESSRDEIIEKIPEVLKDFNLKDDDEKLIKDLTEALEGQSTIWEKNLRDIFDAYSIYKSDDIIQAILSTSTKENKHEVTVDKLRDVIDECDVVVHCDCPAFYYQGIQQDDSLNNNARYRFQGTSGNHKWSLLHSMSGGKTGRALCKHLQSVKDSLDDTSLLNEIIAKL